MKEKIFNLVKRAVELSGQQGYAPDDAIRKVAEENNLNEDFVHRVVATYNTARTVNIFDKSGDKTVKFALADPANILAGRIQDRKSELVAPTVEKAPEHDYLTREAFFVDGDQEFEADLAKFAGEEVKEASASFTVFNPIYKYLEKEARDVQEITLLRDSLYEQAFSELSKAAVEAVQEYGDIWNLKTMESQAMRKLGPEFAKFAFDWISAKAGIPTERATEMDPHRMVIWENQKLGEELEKVAGLFDICAKVEFHLEKDLQKLADHQSDMGDVIKMERQPSNKNELNRSGTSQESSGEDPSLSGAFESLNRAVGETGDIMHGARQQTKDIFGELLKETPEESKMRGDVHVETENVRRSLLLQDLVKNDPVLSQEDPQSLAKAYETLVNIAPSVSLNPSLTRSIMRAMSAQQAIGPFEGLQIAKLETEMRKQLEPLSRKSPKSDED